MGQLKEHYNAKPMAANTSLKIGVTLAGFLANTAGTITVTDADGTVLVDAYPCTAGQGFIRIPVLSNTSAGMTVTLAGGASGTLFT
jgi:hypothetical protein